MKLCFYHLISFPTERLAGELAVKNEPRPKIVAEIRNNENNSSALAGFTLAIVKLIGYSLAFTLQAGFAGVAMIAGLALAAVALYLLVLRSSSSIHILVQVQVLYLYCTSTIWHVLY